MDDIDPERWRQAGLHFHELVELDPSARSERLSCIGDTDPLLRAAIERLLAGDAVAEERLPIPGFGIGSSPRPSSRDPLNLIGNTIAQFHILEHIASGGMGIVYRAEDTRLRRAVALKFPQLDRQLTHSTRSRILEEARAAGALDHPNVCPIFEVGESPAGPFLAMPLYRGETLKERLARGPLPLKQALEIIAQVSTALSCAHETGIVHQDIKPGNIMLLPNGTVKVLDFGLARVTSADSAGSQGLFGTVHYMAPEQVRGEPADARTDLWALGVVLCEMLTGLRPFSRQNEAASLQAILHAEPPAPSESDSATPSAVDALIRSLLKKDRASRFPSAGELTVAIAAIQHGAQAHGILRRRRNLSVGVGLTLVAVAALAAFLRHRTSATLLDRGVLEPRDSLILADFEVPPSDSGSGVALTAMLRRDFSDSRLLMTPEDVSLALNRMKVPKDTALSVALARDVARREGVRAVISPQLARLGSGYLLTIRLVAAERGTELTAVSRPVRELEAVLPTLATLGRDLRRKIGESLRGVPAFPASSRKLTTTSLAAARLTSKPGSGFKESRQAVALDSTFAYAWMMVGNVLTNLGVRTAAQDSAFTMAYRFRENLSIMEQAQVTSLYWNLVWRDRRRSLEALESALAQDSTIYYAVAMNTLDRLTEIRQFERAEAFGRRIAQWKVGNLEWTSLLRLWRAQVGQGKYLAADSTVTLLAQKRGVDDPNTLMIARAVALSQLLFDSAEALHTRILSRSNRPGAQTLTLQSQLLRLRGRLAEAGRTEAQADSLLKVLATDGGVRFLPEVRKALTRAREDLWLRNRPAGAVRSLDSVMRRQPTALQIQDRIDGVQAAALYAAAGQPAQARALLERSVRGADTVAKRAFYEHRLSTLAEIALAEGRFRDALELFRESDFGPDGLPVSPCRVCVMPQLARAAERAGWPDSARRFWERYVTEPAVQRLETDQWFLAMAYRNLVTLARAQGDSVNALGYARKLADLWKRADPDLVAEASRLTLTTAWRCCGSPERVMVRWPPGPG
jgi:serine/threonine protein kinase/tetratricopeptide (TPR) repeat protein